MSKLLYWLNCPECGNTLTIEDRTICDLEFCDWMRFWKKEI